MPQSSGMSDFEQFDAIADRPVSPHAAQWLWYPWYAKLFWTSSVVYWAGLYGLLLVPNDQQNYYLANAMILLVFVFNPITVVAVLGYGFLKAKVVCGDWVVVPGMPDEHAEWLRRERVAAYINPADARSGYMHRRYLDRFKH